MMTEKVWRVIWNLDVEWDCLDFGHERTVAHVEESRWWPTYGYSMVRRGTNKRPGGDWKMLLKVSDCMVGYGSGVLLWPRKRP